jgi:hypothetical protein
MKVVDVANEIYVELGEPSTLSIPPITFWLRTNIGLLNSRINTDFYIDSTDFEIKTVDKSGAILEICVDEANILKKMYMIYHYDVKLRESLGAASTDTWVEISTDGTSVRRVNKIQQSQTYQTAKKTEMEDLDKLIAAYQRRASAPLQVAGDDTTAGDYGAGTDFNRPTTNPS